MIDTCFVITCAIIYIYIYAITDEDSVVSIGVANKKFPLNKHPGKLPSTVGWTSRDGRLHYSGRFDGNILGERYHEGMNIVICNVMFSCLGATDLTSLMEVQMFNLNCEFSNITFGILI